MSKIKRDCNLCQKRANETCTKLSNVPCSDFRIIPDYNKDEWKAAADALDINRGRKPRKGDNNFAPSHDTAHSEPVAVQEGTMLWYKNKRTGNVEYGLVTSAGIEKFSFHTGKLEKTFPYSIIGDRLFLTKSEAEAKEYTKKKKQ